MKRFQIILSVFIGTLMYSMLSFAVGPRGIWPMKQLLEQKDRLTANLGILYTLNESLDSHIQNLSSDRDTISIYAHELGYISEGEKLIKLAGFSGGIDRNLVAGNAISQNKPKFLPEWLCKFLGLLSGFFVFYLHRHYSGIKRDKKVKRCNTDRCFN